MKNEDRNYMVLMGSVLLLIGLLNLVNHKNPIHMDVYLSKANTTIPEDIEALKQELPNCNIVEYLGGKYSNAPLLACDKIVTVLNEDTSEVTVGRGQYSELEQFGATGKESVLVYVDQDDEIIKVFVLDSMEKNDGGGWKEYGTLSITEVARYDAMSGEFEDYVKNK